MGLKIYNTLTRKKEEFKPQKDKEVKMYVCGITPYDEPHLGHARCYVAFDVIRKYLAYLGYQTEYIQNYTDIDDKIIARANELNEDPFELANRFIKSFNIQMEKLNINPPDISPRVSEHIQEIIKTVQVLIEKGFAYNTDGDVYFSVEKFQAYGKLSGQALEEMKVGARVAPDEKKRNPLDFALWKKSKQGEPFWKSPWGDGRPGWHIECSAMSMKYLGATLDIHGGGQDLIFPHHENEIAQSEAYSDKPFVRYWVHNGFVTINREKMSKSLGNFFTLKEIYEKYSPDIVRLFLIWQHYRTPLDFARDKLEEAKKILTNFRDFRRKIMFYIERSGSNSSKDSGEIDEFSNEIEKLKEGFISAMNDDINTAQALAALNKMVTYTNDFMKNKIGRLSKEGITMLRGFIRNLDELGGILGLDFSCKSEIPDGLKRLIEEREKIRNKKDWKESDRIRRELLEEGVALEDTPIGTFWRHIDE